MTHSLNINDISLMMKYFIDIFNKVPCSLLHMAIRKNVLNMIMKSFVSKHNLVGKEYPMLSSLGFHTMTLDLSLLRNDVKTLLLDFKTYSETIPLKIYRKKEKEYVLYTPSEDYLPSDIKIYYDNQYCGIQWHLYEDYYFANMCYIIEVKINPKFLAGIHDYLTAATYSDMNIAMINFNRISKNISSLLGKFDDYRIKRVDYCINICLSDFQISCSPEQAMNLIKRSDIPPHYKEWMEYDKTSHRMKSKPESFYLCSKSVNINYYSKYLQLQNRSEENVENGYNPVDLETLDASQDIYRFEVQCKYYKTYSLSKRFEDTEESHSNKYKQFLDPVTCIEIVSSYYEKVIGKGDWYTLQEAVRKVKSKNFNSQKEKRLINALQYISQCRSLAKAKASLHDYELDAFKRTLKELSGFNINPVTIPKEWGIEHIPNLLCSYFNRLIEEAYRSGLPGADICTAHGYAEYVEKYGRSPI